MSKPNTYVSPLLEAVHDAAVELREIGGIGMRTMRRFDRACLARAPGLTAEQELAIRRRTTSRTS